MTRQSRRDASGARVGIALSATACCVAELGGDAAAPVARRAALEPMNGGNGAEWPSLAAALRELAPVPGHAAARLAVALMPGLTEVRRLELPPMREEELRQLLTRSASRYFVAMRGSAVVGTIGASRGLRGAGRTAGAGPVAAAAPARLVAAIHSAAREAGFAIESISPAEGAWARAAATLWPATARGALHLLVAHEDRSDLLSLDGGRLAGVRHFRAGAADAALVADAIRSATPASEPARVGAIGVPGQRRELTRALGSLGIAVAPAGGTWADAADAPDLLAATFAGARARPLLVSDETRAAQRADARRATRLLVATAAGLALFAAALELWGVRRELAAVQEQRAAIGPEIASTLVGRTTVETAFRQLTALAAADRAAPRWSRTIAGLTAQLPDEAYLTAFRGRGDSVVVNGLATHAARVFEALERTPGLADVRAAAPVRRESAGGAEAMEHFTIGARRVGEQRSAKVAP